MALNFPDNPTVGDSYTSGTHTWQWDGVAWTTVSSTLGLDTLSDVVITAPLAADQGIFYNGTTWVNTTHGLDNLSDVVITAPLATDQGIFYNGTNWVNTTHTHNINQLSGTYINGPASGQILGYNGIYWTNMAPADTGFNPFLLMGA